MQSLPVLPLQRLNPLRLKQRLKQKATFELLQHELFGQFQALPVDTTEFQQTPLPVEAALKILLVSETWSPEINGVAHSMGYLCQGLQQRGHDLYVIRPEPETEQTMPLGFRPIQHFYVRGQKIPHYPLLRFGWPEYKKIQQILESVQPDIVHIVTEGPLGLATLYVAKQLGLPMSSAFHSSFQEFSRYFQLKFLFKPIQQYLRWFHNSTQVTCVPSTYTMQELMAFGVNNHIHVVGRGVDTQRFSSRFRDHALRCTWGADEETTVLIYVGRLSPEKQVDQIVQAYQLLKLQQPQRKHKLVLVGAGPDMERLRKMDEDVIFMGALSGEMLSKAYASADVFAFSSLTETFGNVVLEAMASGLAVIAFNYACAAQFIQHEHSGYLIAREQPQNFLEFIRFLPELSQLQQVGQRAMHAIQDHGWDIAVQQFERALYQAKKLQYSPQQAWVKRQC